MSNSEALAYADGTLSRTRFREAFSTEPHTSWINEAAYEEMRQAERAAMGDANTKPYPPNIVEMAEQAGVSPEVIMNAMVGGRCSTCGDTGRWQGEPSPCPECGVYHTQAKAAYPRYTHVHESNRHDKRARKAKRQSGSRSSRRPNS